MQISEEIVLKNESLLPLTQAQKELWLLAQIESRASVAYNVCNAIELRGALRFSALQKAMKAVVDRHDALRASVDPDGETLTVAGEFQMELDVEDISHLSGSEQQECLRRETAGNFDLTAPPLLRAKLFRTGPQAHVLLLMSHHIVVDGASMQTLLRELGTLYSSFVEGQDGSLPTPPSYAAYVERQEKIRGTEKWSASEEYWLRLFRTQPPVLEIPADDLRPNAKTYNGAAESLLIEPALAEALEALSAAHSTTLFMTLFGGFAALVRRLSGQEDLVLGINVSRRIGKSEQGLVGYLTNLLPIRIAVSHLSTVSDLLTTTRDTLLAALEHREYGLGDLVRKLNPERVPGRSPLVDVAFNFDRNAENWQFAGLETQLIPAPLTAAKYDLDFNVIETRRGLLCYVEYNTDLFRPETIRRFLRLWRNLLSGLAAQPQASLLDLPWMDSQEWRQVVFDWNRTQKPYPQESIVERLEAQASRTPNATAVAYEAVELSYRELNEKANRLAHHMRSAGVGREVRVGVYLERGLDWVVSILAVWKAGGVYMPLDIAYPKDRLAFMLEDAAGVLLTEDALQAELPPHSSRSICIDLEWESIDQQSGENPGVHIYPEDLAYVLYTSGSTGQPKGVMIEHGGMMNHLWAKVDDLGLSAEDIVAQNASPSFDVSVWQIFSALLVGGVVQIIGETHARDSAQLLAEVHRLGATVLETVPTLLGAMVEHQEEYGERRLSLQKLRWMICNAEPLPVSLCRRWAALYPRVSLLNAYGLTECSDDVNHLLVEGPLTGLKYAPLGKPLPNMRLYVLDEGGQSVPIGVAGELHVGGICVGRGYLGRPELTAEKFVPDPFSEDPGARLYKTSDRVRLLPDGSFDFVARLDHQVKLRGFRIELPEIEATLNQHPGVIRSVVIVREDEPGDQRLVGYVVARAGEDGASLKTYLRERLPQYMVPSAIELLDRMPLTANEKIDRKALPMPKDSGRDLSQEYLAPRDRVEEILAEIWAEVLRVERVGIEDNFFGLGGHSLLAIQVIARIRKLLQVELPLRRLFEAPTVAALAQAVEEARSEASGSAPAPIERVSREYPLPLSYAQQRLWFLRQFETDPTLYNMQSVLRIVGDLQVRVLERAMEGIVQRHEVLRTTFVEDSGTPMQIINPPWPVQIPVIDLRSGEADPKTEVERLIREEVQRPFDLARGPLLRARLLRIGDAEYIYLVGMHHIAGDGWSMEVFLQDLAALYDAFLLNKPSPLPELPFQYVDYASWQRSWLEGQVMERQLDYWKARLKGMPHALELPAISSRPDAPSHQGREYTFMLSRELSASIQALSRAHGVTLFVTLLTAFQALLSRYSGQTDIVLGGAIANRSGQMDALMGFFVNSLVLRTDLSGRPSFAELLHRVQEVVLGALANQDVPFERLVEELQPQRDMSRTPLFQVMFDLQRPMSIQSASLAITEEAFEYPMEKFDLSLRIVAVRDGLKGILLYQTDLFDAETITGIANHLEVLLTSVTASPERPIEEIPLLTQAEEKLVLGEWNRTERVYPSEQSLQELFERQVEADPQGLALVQGGSRLTYRDLNRRANQLAHYLLSRGVGPEVPVGLCLERGVEMVVAMLAVLKAGGAYIPLDPGYPADRLEQMIADTALPLVITEDTFLGRFWDLTLDTVAVSMESLRDELASLSPENPPRVNSGDDLAYVIYTSGSTGAPKGIMIPHRAVTRLVINTDYVDLRPGDRVAQVSNASFDAATFEVWGALLNGAALVIIDKDIALSPAEFGRQLQRERVTTMFLTTALFNQTVQADREVFRGLRYLLFGGEAVDPRWVGEALGEAGPEHLLHVYGPTETTTFATWFHVREVEEGCRTIPIGGPIANTRAYVLDEHLQPVPPSLPGEIYLGGPGVARGYWGNPELTAERFVPDPFSGQGGERLYRTGDKALYRHDGAIEFLGRADDQVKLRGYRIEIGEIEASLKRHEAVKDAVVVLREDDGERRLVGYVVVKPGETLAGGAVREWLKKRLPDYMVPSAVVELAELPLNANGKVDRQALPAPGREDRELEDYAGPRTELEESLCRIWAETLQVERVGITDNFFELGGHSLLAMRVISKVRSDLGVELGLRTLFEWPTVADLAERIEPEPAGAIALSPITPAEDRINLPLSYAQSRLWFINQLQPESVAYNAPLHLRLTGELDRSLLEECMTEVVRRHEILRTSFPTRNGQPVQEIHPPGPIEIPLIDLSSLPAREREEVARGLRQQDAEQLFDLARGPLFRATLLRLDAEESQLLLAMHHIVTDGWSNAILIEDLFALWNARSQGKPSPLPEPHLQYSDYAVWQRQWLEQGVLKTQLSYWRKQLLDVPTLDLPTDRPRSPVANHRGAELLFSFSPEQSATLTEWGQQENATLFMVLLAGFQWILSRYSMQEDFAVGTVITNRNRRETEGLVGFFVNPLVLRTDLSGSPTFRDLVRRVREVTTSAYTHQDLPFEKLVEDLNLERDLLRSPIFQVRFTLDNEPPPFPAASGLQVDEIYIELPEVKFELTLAMQSRADGTVGGCLIYAADLFERQTAERLVEQFQSLLAKVMADPETPLTSIPLIGEEEYQRVVVEWNRTNTELPRERCVPELFEQRAALTPNAPAAVYEGVCLSYSELDGKASQLAGYLGELGVGPEVRVGIFMKRGLEMVIALLGVLKAGGAYVPIDPANPSERTAFILEDAQIPVLLTQEALLGRLPSGWFQTVCVDAEWSTIESHSAEAPPSNANPDNLAYLIYTSGSTGLPKAVGIEHRQLVNYIETVSREMDCASDWKFAFLSSVAADLGNTMLFVPLCLGGELHIISEELAGNGWRLGEYFRDEKIDCTKITPSHLAGLQPSPDLLPARLLVLGGESSNWNWVNEIRSLRPDCRIMNHYGPTECTVGAVACRLEHLPVNGSENVPLGRPLGNVQAYVLDQAMQPVPVGMAGELYIAGAGVGRFYLDRQELTAERFVPDFFGDRPGTRLYRTGDKARWLPGGVLEFLGRVDHQVKIRGFRVELAEIESALKQHLEVAQAAVLLHEGRSGHQRLVAYVTCRQPDTRSAPLSSHAPSDNGSTSVSDPAAMSETLQHYLKERLPDYMVPSAIMVLPTFPLTASGKVDRRALPQPEITAEVRPAPIAPRTELEKLICDIWADALGYDQVGIQDDFFALGGHSLLAIKVISRIESAMGGEIPLVTMFTASTVAKLASEIERARSEKQPSLPTLVRVNRADFIHTEK